MKAYTRAVADPVPRTFKRYKNAPIIEAVIELRVTPAAVDRTALEKIAQSLKPEFPKQGPMQRVQMGISAQDGRPVHQSMSQTQVGLRLAKSDDSRILQLRNEGWAYSHMSPYSEWSVFKAEAVDLWQQYRSACPSAKLTRCGLRYINKLDIPGDRIEPSDYFKLYTEVPDSLPQQDVIGMEMSLQMPQNDLGCVAHIGQVMLGEPASPSQISIVLDIDVFRLGIEGWSDHETWEYLDKLRERKNEIFEGCITDRTRELINK